MLCSKSTLIVSEILSSEKGSISDNFLEEHSSCSNANIIASFIVFISGAELFGLFLIQTEQIYSYHRKWP